MIELEKHAIHSRHCRGKLSVDRRQKDIDVISGK